MIVPMRAVSRIDWLLVAMVAAAFTAGSAAAQSALPAGKTVQMIIGFGPGGGYDLWGRTIARHLGRHPIGGEDLTNIVRKSMQRPP